MNGFKDWWFGKARFCNDEVKQNFFSFLSLYSPLSFWNMKSLVSFDFTHHHCLVVILPLDGVCMETIEFDISRKSSSLSSSLSLLQSLPIQSHMVKRVGIKHIVWESHMMFLIQKTVFCIKKHHMWFPNEMFYSSNSPCRCPRRYPPVNIHPTELAWRRLN